MNFNTYGSIYSNFKQCSLSMIRNDVIIFDLGNSPYETWTVSRMYPYESIAIDSNRPFLLALKSFFKSDVTASVVSNPNYLWTVLLGNERMIYPISRDTNANNTLRFYATPYFVTNPQVVSRYVQSMIKPAYENIYFYKSTIMYLDNYDAPYPGGSYFSEHGPTDFYRLCFLSDEPIEYVLNLAAVWQNRHDVLNIPFMTMSKVVEPKFMDVKPVSGFGFSESSVTSSGMIQRRLSPEKPELVIQDILTSYYRNMSRYMDEQNFSKLVPLGLIIEWPLEIIFENSKPIERTYEDRKFITLSINGTSPKRVVQVLHPYDRYIEYSEVPASTVWTPISFVYTTLLTDITIQKVIVDTVVIGLVYRQVFFCLSYPLLEGRPARKAILNTEHILSVATIEDLESDPNIRILESLKYDDKYSLRRVALKNISLETWCLTVAENKHPKLRSFKLPYLVKEWLQFFTEAKPNTFEIDISLVRLALMLSKHNICYNLIATNEPTERVDLTDNQVKFYTSEKIVDFINEARIRKMEAQDDTACVVS